MGIKCPQCKQVLVPPRSTCPRCVSVQSEWVEVGDKGALLTCTVVHHPEPHYPSETPLVYGIIQLDGADTGLAHILGDIKMDDLKIGMRVQAVFRDVRQGDLTDIKHFKPL